MKGGSSMYLQVNKSSWRQPICIKVSRRLVHIQFYKHTKLYHEAVKYEVVLQELGAMECINVVSGILLLLLK